jgi:putative ABC transport system permease protein
VFHNIKINLKTEDGMFIKILKRDFKRKRAMNTILFVFMLTASILIASSTNLMYSTSTAVDYFIQKSKVADVISLTFFDQKIIDSVESWSRNSQIVKEYEKEDAIYIDEKKVTASTGKLLRDTSALVVMTKPEKYNLIFDLKGRDFSVGPSMAAVPVSIQKKLGLVVGDRLTLNISGCQKEFTVSCIYKDAVFGSELMGYKRIIVNKDDFDDLYQKSTEEEHLNLWGMSKAEGYLDKDLAKDFSDLSLPTETIMTKDVINTVYLFDLVMAADMLDRKSVV